MSVNDSDLQKLHRLYQNHLIEDTNPYLLFHARHHENHILAYNNGKVLLQGEQVSSEIIVIKKHLGLEDYAAIGSDEVGTGDVFGPVVVCAAFVDKDDYSFLEQLNVRDSKLMTDKEILVLGPKLAAKLTHSLLILPPKKYNELTNKQINLNKMKALLHNQAIIKTQTKVDKDIPVIVDQFCQPNLYFNYLIDETRVYRNILFYTKAESVHIAVAVASIIARYAFLVKMNDMSNEYHYEFKKGATSIVDEQIKLIIKEGKQLILPLVAKMNFKNITKLLHD
jgi:ribonuclease HIII